MVARLSQLVRGMVEGRGNFETTCSHGSDVSTSPEKSNLLQIRVDSPTESGKPMGLTFDTSSVYAAVLGFLFPAVG